MQFLAKMTKASTQHSDCLMVAIHDGLTLTNTAHELNQKSHGYILKTLKEEEFTGKFGTLVLLRDVPGITAKRVLIIGCGKPNEVTTQNYRRLVLCSMAALSTVGVSKVVSYFTDLEIQPPQDLAWKIQQHVEATGAALYRYTELKSIQTNPPIKLKELLINLPSKLNEKQIKQAIHQGQAITNGTNLVKNLANLPANLCTPTHIANEAKALMKHSKKIQVQVFDEKGIKKLGMNALLAVAQGSKEPPRFIVINYKGGKATDKPYALVGKGVTFDSGGISIKPAMGMDEMKYDMCGGATVLGVIKTIAELQLPINVVGLVPSTENMPGGNATRPGDIVKTLSGQTVEILNTDAEGRLILCDALSYCERFKPKAVIDIATLTGAIIIALGNLGSGLFTTSDKLATELQHASDESGDRIWRMPMWEEYGESLQSNFADLANIGAPGGAGSIMAAIFLSRFTMKYPWAHLDIAGTAWRSGKEKGATGRPLGLLVQWLMDRVK